MENQFESNQKGIHISKFKRFILFCAVGFGSGLVPVAPGTFGTLAAVLIYVLLLKFLPIPYYLVFLLVTFLLGIYFCHVAVVRSKTHDHPSIVWDEFVGYWITMFLAPPGWIWILVGFLLFRLFDIIKPWPIIWIDRKVKGGFGVMIDDVLAGIFAWVVLQGVSFLTMHYRLLEF